MKHNGGDVSRLISIQGLIDNGDKPIYRHPADEQPDLVPYTPTVKLIKEELEKNIVFNLITC
jgi:hypothetical protein